MKRNYSDYLMIDGSMDCDKRFIHGHTKFEIERLREVLVAKYKERYSGLYDPILVKIYSNQLSESFIDTIRSKANPNKYDRTIIESVTNLNNVVNNVSQSSIYDKLRQKIRFRLPKDIAIEENDHKLLSFVQQTAKQTLQIAIEAGKPEIDTKESELRQNSEGAASSEHSTPETTPGNSTGTTPRSDDGEMVSVPRSAVERHYQLEQRYDQMEQQNLALRAALVEAVGQAKAEEIIPGRLLTRYNLLPQQYLNHIHLFFKENHRLMGKTLVLINLSCHV